MTYNPSIPAAGTRISSTYNLITDNFGQLNTLYALDHYAWNDATVANRGHHKAAQFISQAGDPAPVLGSGIVYTKTGTSTELYYEYPTGTVVSLTPGGSGHSGFQAYGTFNNNGAASTFLSQSSNISSVTYSGGIYTITLSSPLPSANYRPFSTLSWDGVQGDSATRFAWYSPFTPTTTQFKMLFYQVGNFSTSVVIYAFAGLSAGYYGTFGITGA